MEYYTYILFRDTEMTDPFYVGKGKGNRWLVHEKEKGHTRKNNVIRLLLRTLGHVPKLKVAENLSSKGAYALETKLIAQYGRLDLGTGCLTNTAPGGHCGPPQKGKKWTEEQRARIRGRIAPNKGMSSPLRGTKRPREICEKIKATRARKNCDALARESSLRMWQNPEYRAAHTGENNPMRGRKNPNGSAATTKRNNERWTDPEYRAQMSANLKRIAQERMADPEKRARAVAAVAESNRRRTGKKMSPEAIRKRVESRMRGNAIRKALAARS